MFRLATLTLLFLASLASVARSADRPNVVWILSEDNSIHFMSHFFPGGADTPNISALAAHGLTFDHAFSNAPVCSVARTTLATACYGPRIGTQFHRRYRLANMPEGLRMFPAYLRDAGYYTTNNSKKDYNAVESADVWDESSNQASWRNRQTADQPFFHMETHGLSHEGSLHFGANVMNEESTKEDPATVTLADYHPDTPTFRYTHARYHDRIQIIDDVVGNTIAKLESDGLLEDTFVFYFGDHGGVLPRGKGYIYESGLHVPLVVRVPENFRDLVSGDDTTDGTRVKGFVEFVDFGPTVLNLAGVNVPEQVDGTPFLGNQIKLEEVNVRDETFGYADRFDEKYDLVRSIRKGRFQYIRNYQPYLPDGLNNNYRYKALAYQEWRQLFEAGKLDDVTRQFFEPKSVEMLFDCEADPHQVHNLAADPAHHSKLLELRARLQERMLSLPDLSFYPESHLSAHAMDNPVAFGKANQKEIVSMAAVADLALLPFADAKPELRAALASDNSMIRYWGAMACSAFGQPAESLVTHVRPLLDDSSEIVRVRAAEFLGLVGAENPQNVLTEVVNTTENPVVATEALNSVVLFRDFFDDRYPVARSDFAPVASGADIADRLNYINGIPYPPKQRPQGRKNRQGK